MTLDFGFIEQVFYYGNKCSNSGPDNFGLIKWVSLLTVSLISGDCCINNNCKKMKRKRKERTGKKLEDYMSFRCSLSLA